MIFIWVIWIILTIYLFFFRKTTHYYNVVIPLNENVVFDMLNEDAQNVHDPVVRSIGAEKYHYLFSKIEAEYKYLGRGWLQTIKNTAMNELKSYREFSELYLVLQENTQIILASLAKVPIPLTESVPFAKDTIPLTDSVRGREGKETVVGEQDIFALVWMAFKKLDFKILLEHLRDCYEDGHPVCPNGRIARYLASFVGSTEDILGKSEITEKILFGEALRETKKLIYNALEKKNGLKNTYELGGTDEEEERLDAELLKIIPRIKRHLERSYPQLSSEKINELLTAI